MMAMLLPPSALPGISPSRGEIGRTVRHCSSATFVTGETALHPISPLEGEMPGRAEGGNPASPEATR